MSLPAFIQGNTTVGGPGLTSEKKKRHKIVNANVIFIEIYSPLISQILGRDTVHIKLKSRYKEIDEKNKLKQITLKGIQGS